MYNMYAYMYVYVCVLYMWLGMSSYHVYMIKHATPVLHHLEPLVDNVYLHVRKQDTNTHVKTTYIIITYIIIMSLLFASK